MKKILLLLIVGSYSLVSTGKDIPVSPVAKAATVFLQGAEINYSFSATIPSGMHNLLINNVPQTLNPATIQIGVGGNVIIQSSEFKIDYLHGTVNTGFVKILTDSIELLNERKNRLVIEKSMLNDALSVLNSNKSIAGANIGMSVVELQKLMDYYQQKGLGLKNGSADIDLKLKKIDERINKMSEQLNQENGKGNVPFGQIVVLVQSKVETTASFNLSFVVNDAGWTPLYDVRCENIKSPVKLTYKAQVYQNTGMNWNNIKLTLGTGNPNESGTSPILSPWFLSYYNPNTYKVKGGRNSYSLNQTLAPAAPSAAYDAPERKDMLTKGVSDYTTITENQLSAIFEIDLPYDIPNDGKTHLVSVAEYDLPATYEYYAVPKLDKDAFLLARITNWEKLNLVGATANIFFEGNYIGQSTIDPLNTRDTLSLSLGRDKKVIIKRQKVKESCNSKMIGLNKTETFVYDITVRNSKKESIPIIILDQFPISQVGDLEIELQEWSKAVIEKERGQLMWRLNLNPGESKVLRIGFTAKFPKDKSIGSF
jgi:uncharacterized protein (TIGR02231 family)